LFTLIETLLCEIMGIVMSYVVRPSDCDHLAKHATYYESDFINDVHYKLLCFGIGFGGVRLSAKIYFECLAMILVIGYEVKCDFVKWTIPLKETYC